MGGLGGPQCLPRRHPGEELADPVQVVDRPGTDDDEAVFQASTAIGATHEVRLGRDQHLGRGLI
ncbi:MAG: hypothetical protein H0W03_07975 [Solirubrobacterales bacterium]|nr:hypothetical protein [Solirubrobacterales bacterium]